MRWTRPDRGDTWSIGCQFSRFVDWETLGELFLDEVLSQEPASHVPADAPDDPSSAPPAEGPLEA